MSKINKAYRILLAILKQPALLNLIIDDSSYHRQFIPKSFLQGLPTLDLMDYIKNVKQIDTYSFGGGGSLITDLLVLKASVLKFEQPTYFEIGTWRGESIVNVADDCQKAYTLDLPNEELSALGVNEKKIKQQGLFSKNHPKIVHLKGNSATFNFTPFFGKMDVVFIDGDHHYEAVKKDTQNAFKLIKNKKSIIIWHDYLTHDEMIRYEVLRGIIEETPKELRKYLYHIHQTLCAVYIYNPASKIPPKNLHTFRIEISSNP